MSALRTYGDDSIVRSVQAEIEMLSPVENMLLNNLQKSTARNMVHQWQDDTLATPTGGAAPQYQAFTPDTLSTPTLRQNVVQHIYQAVSVTEAQQMVTHESGEKEYARQVAKKMKDWANNAEYALLRSSLVSGVSGTAARMNGVIQTISTNATAHTSGTVFSESIFNGLFELNWENSNGETATDVLVGAKMKRKISSFTANITRNIDVSAARAGAPVQVYESDFGTVNIHLHRYMQESADATARVLGVNMDKLYVAYLGGEGVKMTEQGVRSTSKDAVINGYLTLENRNEATCFFADGFLKEA